MGSLAETIEDRRRHEENLKALFPSTATFSGSGKEIDTALASPTGALRRSRRAISPILEARLGPALAAQAARQLGRPGATIEGVLAGLSITGGAEVANELSGIQQEILATRKNLKAGAPQAPGVGESTLGGAAQGFAVGGPIGALPGGAIGLAKGISGKKKEKQIGSDIEEQTALASQQASPEAFAKKAGEMEPAAREAALAGGAGQMRAQALEEAITASGLRDTGIGTLASIAAGVQVPLEGLAATFGAAMEDVTRTASTTLGQPITAGKTGFDNIARALEGLATIFLTPGMGPKKAERVPENTGFETPPLFPRTTQETDRSIFGTGEGDVF